MSAVHSAEVEGATVGAAKGDALGASLGNAVVGDALGDALGDTVVGDALGDTLGDVVVGDALGDALGDVLGDTVGVAVIDGQNARLSSQGRRARHSPSSPSGSCA